MFNMEGHFPVINVSLKGHVVNVLSKDIKLCCERIMRGRSSFARNFKSQEKKHPVNRDTAA